MKINVVGTGYVGPVNGACMAEVGNNVLCLDLDLDTAKIKTLQEGGIPIHGPGLLEMVSRNVAAGSFHFTTSVEKAVQHGTIQFIAVGTGDLVKAAIAEELAKRGVDTPSKRCLQPRVPQGRRGGGRLHAPRPHRGGCRQRASHLPDEQKLKTPLVFDGRNLYDPKFVHSQGIEYLPIGR